MIDLSKIKDVFVFSGVTDFRNGIEGLTRLVFKNFDQSTVTDNLFVFCNRKKTSLKILHFEKAGIWIYQKKLNMGKFAYPSVENNCRITPKELEIIISGLDFIHLIENNDSMKTFY